ncbi:outer membrane beta-barrel family protein [Prolixibacteraceae bacterium]|nr:outer membrane beta-barrel family protein [Prolixibacteraceae bacterium]
MTKILIFFTLCCFPFLTGICQNSKYLLCNKTDKPIEFASVALMSPKDSTIIKTTTTNQKGEFAFEDKYLSRNYFLKIYHLSYLPMQKRYDSHLAHKIILEERIQSTDEIKITAQRKPIEYKDGKIVANISSIPNYESSSVSKLLKQLPGVTINSNGISLNGSAAYVYIDGRKQLLQGRDAIKLLEAMPSISMDQIELKPLSDGTNDASDGAIINLVSKKQRVDGYFGSIGLDALRYDENNLAGGGNLFYMFKKNDIIFNTSLSFSNDLNWSNKQDSTIYSNGLKVNNDRERKYDLNKFIGSANLAWNSKRGHTLNLNLFGYTDFSKGNTIQDINNWNTHHHQSYTQTIESKGNDDLWSANVAYSSPDSLSYKLRLSYGMDIGGIRNDQDYYNDLNGKETESYLNSESDMTGKRHTFKLDFDKQFKNIGLKVYLGSKAVLGHLVENVYNTKPSFEKTEYPDSEFSGDENIYSGYLKLSQTITHNMTFVASARVEHSNYNVLQNATNTIANKYTNVFPYAHLYYKPSNNYQVIFGYVSSIKRPNYEHLLPGTTYINEYLYKTGNPYLNPTMSNGIALINYLFVHGSIGFRYIQTKDLEGEVFIKKGDNLIESTYLNYADNHQFKINAFIPFEFFSKKLSGYFSFDAVHNSLTNFKNEFELVKGRKSSYWKYNYKAGMDYKLTKRAGLNLWSQYNPEYQSPQFDYGSNWSLDIGATYSLMKNERIILSLNIENIFDSYKRDYTYYFNDITTQQHSHIHGRFVKFSIFMKLNKGEKIRDKAKENVNDTSRFM